MKIFTAIFSILALMLVQVGEVMAFDADHLNTDHHHHLLSHDGDHDLHSDGNSPEDHDASDVACHATHHASADTAECVTPAIAITRIYGVAKLGAPHDRHFPPLVPPPNT
jgi:hypothetical protein